MWRNLVFLLVYFVSFQAKADLRLIYLDITLSADKTEFSKGEIAPFWIEFKNTSPDTYSFILPSKTASNKKIIFFSFFKVDSNNYYTEVYRESEIIEMDTSIHFWNNTRNLKPAESFKFPVFFNDRKNYKKHIGAHHKWEGLPPGDYQMLAWYQPWRDDFANHIYDQVDPFGHDPEDAKPYKFDMPIDGLQSNYLAVSITNSMAVNPSEFQNTSSCPANCWFCRAIEDGQWSKVKKIIDVQTKYTNKRGMAHVDTNWCQSHRNVAWLGPNPEAILLSLPTWSSRNIIFKNNNGYHYYTLRWQLGVVHKARSRFSTVFYWMGFRKPPFRTSEVDYQELVGFIRN